MRFEEYARPGVCAVCGKEADVIVCTSPFGATSYAYCKNCFDNYLEPYYAMVDYISCAGVFPDDINEEYRQLCRHNLKGLGISEEKFIEDVKKAINDYSEYYASLDGDFYDEKDDFC
jgi:hypothetical protein